MCDPLVGGVLAGVASMASAGINYMQQSSAMKAQEDANAQWVSYQRQQSQLALQKDEANRQKAQAAQQQTLTDVNAQSQQQQQQTEQQRITQTLDPSLAQGDTTRIAGDILLAGQKNANPLLQKDVADQVAQASAKARQRIAALSTIQSYGGGQFGLNNTVNNAFQRGNQAIDLTGNYRRGDLAAYNVAKQVEPQRFQNVQSPFGAIATSLAGIAGKGIGSSFGFSGGNFA
jgi:hypothetical protein